MPPLPSPAFQAAMSQLNELTELARSRQRSNLERMALMTARLDDPIFAPSNQPDPATSRSTPEPTPPPSADRSDALREYLPQRTTKGGSYGRSIIERVARNYGL